MQAETMPKRTGSAMSRQQPKTQMMQFQQCTNPKTSSPFLAEGAAKPQTIQAKAPQPSQQIKKVVPPMGVGASATSPKPSSTHPAQFSEQPAAKERPEIKKLSRKQAAANAKPQAESQEESEESESQTEESASAPPSPKGPATKAPEKPVSEKKAESIFADVDDGFFTDHA